MFVFCDDRSFCCADSPAWHIGFAHWNGPATEVVKGLDRVEQLRAEGKLTITELPPVVVDDLDLSIAGSQSKHAGSVSPTIDDTSRA